MAHELESMYCIVFVLALTSLSACATSGVTSPGSGPGAPPSVVRRGYSPLNLLRSFDAAEDAGTPAGDSSVAVLTDAAVPPEVTETHTVEPQAGGLRPSEGVVSPADGHPRMFRGRDEEELLREMATRPVVRVIERFSSSTLVFHMDLGEGLEIGFKPEMDGDGRWFRHEIAGYRLARALGIEGRVPPAVTRRVPIEAFSREQLRHARLVVRGGMVEGAAIYWMPVLRRSDLQTSESRARWVPWLDPESAIPEGHRAEAEQLATLIVFDYLQANFDRWNTANVRLDERGVIVYRDNNRGWFIENLLLLTRGGIADRCRLPGALWANLERATGAALEVEMHRDLGGGHHPGGLGREHYAAYELRRRHLVEIVQSLIGRYSREAVMPW